MRGQGQDPKRKTAAAAQPAEDVMLPVEDDVAGAAAGVADATAQDDALGVDDDPTLDVVRQLIAEAESLPEPEPEPAPEPAPAMSAPPAPAFPEFAPSELDGDGWEDEDPWDDSAEGWDYDQPVEAWEASEPTAARRGLIARAFAALGRGLKRLVLFVLRRIGLGFAWAGRRIWRFLKRPDAPRWLAVAVIAAAAVTWPWFVLKISLLFPLGIITLWAATGNKGFAELVVKWYEWLKVRDPAKAERLRRAAAWTSRTIMAAVDRLPSHWTTGFSLPDFEGSVIVPEKMKVEPFEEFAARVHASKHAED